MNRRLVNGLCTIALGYCLLLATPSAQAWTWQSIVTWYNTMVGEASAWNIYSQQVKLSSTIQATASQHAQQQLATAIGAISMAGRMVDTVASFDGTLGQPVTLKCEAQKNAMVQAVAWEQVTLDRAKLMGTFASTRVASTSEGERERITLHRDNYCTIAEARAGMCELKANGMQGWDSNYAGAFGEQTLAAEGELAGYAYAAMVADTRAPAALDCKSTACAAAASEQLALAATGTMVADAFLGQVMERRVPVLTGK